MKDISPLTIDKKFALTFEEAAVYFGVGENCLRRICKEERCANTFTNKVGAKTLIRREDFEKYMREHYILSA